MADSSTLNGVGSGGTRFAGAAPALSFINDQSGAVLAEYAVLLSLIGLALLSAVLGFGSAVEQNVEQAADTLEEARKRANCEEGAKLGNKWC